MSNEKEEGKWIQSRYFYITPHALRVVHRMRVAFILMATLTAFLVGLQLGPIVHEYLTQCTL